MFRVDIIKTYNCDFIKRVCHGRKMKDFFYFIDNIPLRANQTFVHVFLYFPDVIYFFSLYSVFVKYRKNYIVFTTRYWTVSRKWQ